MDEPKYNEGIIRAKEQQARQHISSDDKGTDRLPPGQKETKIFPILDLGVRPSKERYAQWTLEIRGSVEKPVTLALGEVKKLAGEHITADFHCVTRWSRFDLHWTGIPFKKITELVQPKPSAKFVVFRSFDQYSTNVPLVELEKEKVIVAFGLENEEIPPEHGGPIRMIIPHLYGWKSAKFLTTIEFREQDQPGFWELRGYSNTARPWLEDRYS